MYGLFFRKIKKGETDNKVFQESLMNMAVTMVKLWLKDKNTDIFSINNDGKLFEY